MFSKYVDDYVSGGSGNDMMHVEQAGMMSEVSASFIIK